MKARRRGPCRGARKSSIEPGRRWRNTIPVCGCWASKTVPEKIAALEDRPDDALLRSLTIMNIPKLNWEAYLSLHLAALPGWTGFIKWRSDEHYYPWQAKYPIDLVKYLAVRLFYERELVALHCEEKHGIAGCFDAIRNYMDSAPYGYWLQRELVSGELPSSAATQAQAMVRARTQPQQDWETVGKQIYEETAKVRASETTRMLARQLLALAQATAVTPESILETTPSDVTTLLNWLEGFPPSQQGRRWLQALEARHCHHVATQLQVAVEQLQATDHHPGAFNGRAPWRRWCIASMSAQRYSGGIWRIVGVMKPSGWRAFLVFRWSINPLAPSTA